MKIAAMASSLLGHGLAAVAVLLVPCAAPAAPAGDAAAPALERTIIGGAGGWDYLTADAARHHVFITRGDRVQVFDTRSLTVTAEIADTEGVHGVALAPRRLVGLTSNGKSSTVTVFDLNTLAPVARITGVGDGPDAIVYDEHSGRAFTFNGRSHDASVVDIDAARVISTIALPGRPESAVSDGAGSIYVDIEDRNLIARIDTASLRVTEQWPLAGCDGPTGLAIDIAHRRLFASCSNRTLFVVDADTGSTVSRLGIGAGSDAAAFEPSKALVLSSNRDGTLSLIREIDVDHYASLPSILTRPGARTLALDTATHRVYLVTADFEPTPAAASATARPRPVSKPGTFAVLSFDLTGYPDR